MLYSIVSWCPRFYFLLVAGCVLLGDSRFARGQTDEQHDVEIVSTEDVGRFRSVKDPDLTQVAESIVKRTNQFRETEDLDPLTTDETLRQTAQKFADYMAETNRYGHTADGRQPSQRVAAQGYEFCIVAENIAYHFRTKGIATDALAEQAFTGWQNSPGHRRNMLKPHVTETGVALSQSESTGVYYAVQLFGRPKSASTTFTLRNRAAATVQYTIGERSFELPPKYSRKHQVCRPPTVKVVNGDDVVAERTPENDSTLTLISSDDGVKIE